MPDGMRDDVWDAHPDRNLVRAVRPLVQALSRLHPLRIEGVENVPHGAALLVGNHGMLGYESPFFFERVFAATGRLPVGLADRWFFRVPLLRDLLMRLGGAYGSIGNGLRALRRGELVVCYPGGAREVFKTEQQKYQCLWHRSVGFVRLAIATGAPMVPFAAAGVDDTYRVLMHVRGSGKLLMGSCQYDLPLVWGLGPFPRPVPFWFRVGAPILPPKGIRASDVATVLDIHREVWGRTQNMVDELVDSWSASHRCRAPTFRSWDSGAV
jgi:1-acyl-sn-glycerol-3-phosphate acyltransferase